MTHTISFKTATEKDISLIHDLGEKIWRMHYPSIISLEQIAYMLDMMYSTESLKKQMQNRNLFTIIYEEEKAVGYFSVSENSVNNFFLHKFYMDPTKQRKGIGSKAFNYLIESVCPNFETITLQVNRRNINAVNFYFKHGFVIDRVEDVAIGAGFSMDDFFMILTNSKKRQ